ncbi:uncharacterized protein LOC142520238 [Primulina tabacum]|uniref:uncharacterized protein LOC142520238 n=1 Tax=Primulina tabacum TaxID=48773 RepID=UPI003F59D03A
MTLLPSLVLDQPRLHQVKLALRIDSRVTNNEAEYEAVLAGIKADREVGASRIIIYYDSQLITQQIKGFYEAKDDRMLKYLQLIKAQSKVFVDWSIEQIHREENSEADALAKMASSLSEASTREVLHVSRLVLSAEEETLLTPEDSWMTSLIKFIVNNELPEDKVQAQKIKRQALRFALLNNILYRRSFEGPILKCLPVGEVDYVLREIHEGCRREHLGGISLAWKTMLSGFWWPTISQVSSRVVRACEGCQHHSNFQHSLATLMKPIWASCPFDQWGMDIVGPFPIARAQKKFLLVAVDYFSKWVEAELLAKITEQEVLKFLWKISDNGRQLQGKEITSWCREMKITQSFTSVFYPQASGQTEVENRILVQELKTRLQEEKREQALIQMEAYRGRDMKSYNKKVRIRDFQLGDLVMKKINLAGDVGKLEARWEGLNKNNPKGIGNLPKTL